MLTVRFMFEFYAEPSRETDKQHGVSQTAHGVFPCQSPALHYDHNMVHGTLQKHNN